MGTSGGYTELLKSDSSFKYRTQTSGLSIVDRLVKDIDWRKELKILAEYQSQAKRDAEEDAIVRMA